MKRFFLLAQLVFLLCLLLSPVSADEPIRIGLTLGLTGKYSEMSNMQMKGFRLWESHVNNRGGILGRKVKLIIYDDKSDPRIAKTLYEHLILKDKVDLLFGPYSSEITEAILPITERYGYPVLITGAAADRLWLKGYKGVFGVITPASRHSIGFLEMLVMNNLNNIAIVYADDAFSKDIAKGTKKWAERFGLKIVLYEGFKKGTRDLTEIANKVKNSRADVLIVGGHLEESIDMRLALKNIGYELKAYYASVGPASQAFYDKLKGDADYVFSSSQWEPRGLFPGCNEFYNLFIKKYKEKPSDHAAIAYAGGQILERAIKRAGSLNRSKIRNLLFAVDTLTILGRHEVNKAGLQVRHFKLIIQWQNGKKEVVWPNKLRTAKPIFK